jgi:hypothetical protein
MQCMFVNRSSKYLKMPQALLFRGLRHQLGHPLGTAKEKAFILGRLQLLDQLVYFKISLHLWQTSLNIGSKEQIWPVS